MILNMANFLRQNGVTRINKLDDGRTACCLCFDFFHPQDFSFTTDGERVDVCKKCAKEERDQLIELARETLDYKRDIGRIHSNGEAIEKFVFYKKLAKDQQDEMSELNRKIDSLHSKLNKEYNKNEQLQRKVETLNPRLHAAEEVLRALEKEDKVKLIGFWPLTPNSAT